MPPTNITLSLAIDLKNMSISVVRKIPELSLEHWQDLNKELSIAPKDLHHRLSKNMTTPNEAMNEYISDA